jgi:hypothetical protein
MTDFAQEGTRPMQYWITFTKAGTLAGHLKANNTLRPKKA